MKVKIVRYFSLIIILLSIILIAYVSFSRKVKIEEHKKMINNIIDNKNGFNYINTDVVGYLEIERLNIKNVIKTGVNDNILDENVIGMLEGAEFGINDNDIFLAGHNIKEVFANLHSIEIGDIVKITTNDSCYEYIVNKILFVNEEETSYLVNNHLNQLTMMTCTNMPKQRLIIICDLI